MTDKTKQRIQELVPEVMELKFGCRYRSKTHGYVGVFLGGREIWLERDKHTSAEDDIDTRDEFEILGSLITLAVVLRAIKSVPNRDFRDQVALISGDLNDTRWNLTKDNYDDQSEKTKLFIGKLLGV